MNLIKAYRVYSSDLQMFLLTQLESLVDFTSTSTPSPTLVQSMSTPLHSNHGVTVVIPAAGKSSRFPNMRPKWMLTNPNGKLMIADCLSGLDLSEVDRVVVGVLKEHVDDHFGSNVDAVKTAVQAGLDDAKANTKIRLEIVALPEPTRDMIETIEKVIEAAEVSGPVFLKDCDNAFAHKISAKHGNAVCVLELNRDNEDDVHNVASKNFVGFECSSATGLNVLNSIVEKKVISNFFGIGGYAFSYTKRFQSVARLVQKCRDIASAGKDALFMERSVSDLIWWMMLFGPSQCPGSNADFGEPMHKFHAVPCCRYRDWGTLSTWRSYCDSFRTVFVDLDGTLVKNSGQWFGKIWGSTDAIPENVRLLQQWFESGRVHIVMTTSRTEAFREETLTQLKTLHIPYHRIMFGLPHAKRVLINDFAPTNPFPSAIAVNLPRNSALRPYTDCLP